MIVLRLDDGTAYTVDWNALSRLANNGIIGPAKAALILRARIAVMGNPIRSWPRYASISRTSSTR